MRKEGCIRSPRPRSPSCTTLLYHTFPSLSGVKHIFTHNWALTTSPGLLVPGDVHGSFLHLHHLHAASTAKLSMVQSRVSGEQPPPPLGDGWGCSDTELGGTVKNYNMSNPQQNLHGLCSGFRHLCLQRFPARFLHVGSWTYCSYWTSAVSLNHAARRVEYSSLAKTSISAHAWLFCTEYGNGRMYF